MPKPSQIAHQSSFSQSSRQRNDAYQQAQYGAAIGAGQEAQRAQGMDLASRNAQLAAQQAQYGQNLQSGQFGLQGMQQGFN